MTPLRQRFIDELTRRNYAKRTIQTYVAAVARTAKHFRCSPDHLTQDQLRDFQLHLIAQSVSWSLFNQVACALRFFYRVVLDRPDFLPFVAFARMPQSLPVVLAPGQVRRLLDAVPPGRNRLMLRLAYGCGLRVGEILHLRVRDIDSARHILWVRHGKGEKDRGVPLPDELLADLRSYWLDHRPTDWLFPGSSGRPLHVAAVQRAVIAARTAARLTQPVTCHTLRHCYATHLLEAGTDLPTLQRLLGHNHVSTTMIYVHLRAERLPSIQSPLELLRDSANTAGDGTTPPGTGRHHPSVRPPTGSPAPTQHGPTSRVA